MTESAALRLGSLAAGYPKAWGAEALPKMGGSDLRRKKRQICSYGTRQQAFRFAMWGKRVWSGNCKEGRGGKFGCEGWRTGVEGLEYGGLLK